MLGTLVALAVARMYNLETFTWDMPTGILRDVWLALESSQFRRGGGDKVAWRRSGSAGTRTGNEKLSFDRSKSPSSIRKDDRSLIFLGESYHATQNPSFSVLPPLKSITVLEIDEIAYLAELSFLIPEVERQTS